MRPSEPDPTAPRAPRRDGEPPLERPEVDLHGLTPDQALRRVRQGLHAARVRGRRSLLVITGRGWGNLAQTPVLRRRVEVWLGGAEAAALGVLGFSVTARGGALEVRLAAPGTRPSPGPGPAP